jgi:hypothetical protein
MVQPEAAADCAQPDVPLFTIENDHRQQELPDEPNRQQLHAQQSCIYRRETGAHRRVNHPAQQPHGHTGSQPDPNDLPDCVLAFPGMD